MEKQPPTFLGLLQKSLGLDGQNIEYHAEKGIIHYLMQNYKDSLEELSVVYKTQPEFSAYNFLLAKVHHAAGNDKEALEYIRRALKQRPYFYEFIALHLEILRALGVTTELLQEEKHAQFLLRTEQKILPDGSVYMGEMKDAVLSGYGICYYTDGNYYKGEWKHGKRHGKGIVS